MAYGDKISKDGGGIFRQMSTGKVTKEGTKKIKQTNKKIF